jgi:hypothetical protein
MRLGCLFLVSLSLGCSRSNFGAAESQFVDSLNYLELIHKLLEKVDSPLTLREAESKIPPLIEDFEQLRHSREPITVQLYSRLYHKYHVRVNDVWEGIRHEALRVRRDYASPLHLKLDEWLAKMKLTE